MNPGQWIYYHVFSKPPGGRIVLPIGWSMLAGLAVFALITGGSLAFAFPFERSYNAGMSVLVTLGLVALAFGYRSGMLAVLGATFVALLPAALAVGGVEDYRRERRLEVIEVAMADFSAADKRRNADVFVLKEFRVATEFAHIYRAGDGGAAARAVYYGAAPIVPSAWSKEQEVPAWLGCTGSDERECARLLAHPLRVAAREIYDFGNYFRAADAAAKRFALPPVVVPTFLQHSELPAERAARALTGMIGMPLLGFVVWLVGFLVWRAIRPAKAST